MRREGGGDGFGDAANSKRHDDLYEELRSGNRKKGVRAAADVELNFLLYCVRRRATP